MGGDVIDEHMKHLHWDFYINSKDLLQSKKIIWRDIYENGTPIFTFFQNFNFILLVLLIKGEFTKPCKLNFIRSCAS
jgi:hypothetical protein